MPEQRVKQEKRDEFVALKMLTCFKQLRRAQPNKPCPDIGWMLCLLDTAREATREYDAPKKTPLFCIDCLEPQFETPSGLVCKNGHGGSPSLSATEVEERRRQ
jgi:hypothetical protein